ncbi:Alpha/Beta hydrolase protein [Hyaloraphidium curvatum]|nr:Alpha/Beta hydrolase protein [Hyaloraphidium curvatum]
MFGSDDLFARQMAEECGIVVVDSDYRKGPEHQWPSAVHDVEDAVNWVLSQPDVFDTSRLAVSGFSAGGNLSLVVSSVGEIDHSSIKAVIAIYPVTDLSADPASKVAPDDTIPHMPPDMERVFDTSYIPLGTDLKDPRLSPSFADPALFPPNVLIITVACDNLVAEAEQLAERLKDGKRNVRYMMMPGMPHAWDKMAKKGSKAEQLRTEAYAAAAEVIKSSFGL